MTKSAATLPVVQHVMQDAPFPAVLLSVPLQVDARGREELGRGALGIAVFARLAGRPRIRGSLSRASASCQPVAPYHCGSEGPGSPAGRAGRRWQRQLPSERFTQ